jgi:hypothetical protein
VPCCTSYRYSFAPKQRVGCADSSELQKRGKTQLYVKWKHIPPLSRNFKACGLILAIAIYSTISLHTGSASTKVAPGTAVVLLTILIINLRVAD